jgi:HlyD family secretion protein
MRISRIPMRRWAGRTLAVAALVAVVATLAWSVMPRPVPVETATIARGDLTVTVDAEGRARVHDRYVVAAPLAGTMARIELHPGDTVAAGDVLARIAPSPPALLDARTRAELEGRVSVARAQRKQAAAALGRAEAAATFAAGELDRATTLARQGATPGVEVERAQLESDLAARSVESARFDAAIADDQVAIAEALLARAGKPARADEEVQVRSPVAGRVLRVLALSESAIAQGSPILELGDPGQLEVAVDVLTADAIAVEPGADVEVDGWGGPPLRGRVRHVEPSATTKVSALGIEEQRVSVIVDLVDPPDAFSRLGDGWRVEARIVTWRGSDVVLAPLGALFRDRDGWAVFVVAGGKARHRPVTVGHRGTDLAEVQSGLAVGDQVILYPGERISDGVSVAAR